MPELPDLEVIRRHLAPRLADVTIIAARVGRPTVLRNLLGDDLAEPVAVAVNKQSSP